MGVSDGQDVSAEITNPAFINKNIDDTTPNRLGLGSGLTAQGPAITWAQQQFNSILSFLGQAVNGAYNALPTWTNDDVGASTDQVKTRVDTITATFNGSTGHAHSGSDGDGAPVEAVNIADVPLRGYGIQGTGYTTTAASSDDVTTLLTGRPVSTGSTVAGVVSTTPYNKTILRNSSGAEITDALGNTVYGRLTYSSSTWTHSYYSLVSGTETAYTFLATTVLIWYFQQLYNPLNGAPTYDPGFVIPSADATADVEPATQSLQGKVLLSSAAGADVGSSGAIGTANATVANADHVHKGVHSLAVSATQLFGDVILAAAGLLGVSITSQTITYTLVNPLTTLGDILYGGVSGAWTRLAGNATTTRKFLVSQGTGSAAAPFYDVLGTADIPAVATATASSVMSRDANANTAVNNLNEGFTSTATAASSTTLTVASTGIQQFTGSTTQIVNLPDCTTLVKGFQFQILNRSSGAVSVKDAGGTLIQAMAGATQAALTCTNTGSSAGAWDNAYTVVGGSSGGGGGGGALEWVEYTNAPTPVQEYAGVQAYSFVSAAAQLLYAVVRVPTSYVSGKPIVLKLPFYTPDSSGTALLSSLATLIRTGTDSINSTTNQRTSSNTAMTLSSTLVPQTAAMDLTDTSGKINSVSVSAGDTIIVALTRGTDTGTSDLRALVYDAEVTFS